MQTAGYTDANSRDLHQGGKPEGVKMRTRTRSGTKYHKW